MKLFSIFAVLALSLVVVAGSAMAFGFGSGMGQGFGKERNEEVHNAIVANDYDAWKEAVQNSLSEEKFDDLVERYNGRVERAAENGVDIESVEEAHQDMKDAVDNGDYDDYVLAAESLSELTSRDFSVLEEDDFNILVEIHDLREAGDFDAAEELAEDLDMPMHNGNAPGFGKQMKGMQGMGQQMRQRMSTFN